MRRVDKGGRDERAKCETKPLKRLQALEAVANPSSGVVRDWEIGRVGDEANENMS